MNLLAANPKRSRSRGTQERLATIAHRLPHFFLALQDRCPLPIPKPTSLGVAYDGVRDQLPPSGIM